jgi:hypothetical protein
MINQDYLDKKIRPEAGLLERFRVATDIIAGKYNDDRWPRFVQRFTFVSFIAFPLFAAGWWMLAHWTFPSCG